MLPSSIQIIPSADAVRVVLPVRPRTAPRWMGCGPIIFGLFFSGFAIFWMAGASGIHSLKDLGIGAPAPAQNPGPEAVPAPPAKPLDWGRLLFACFGIPFFVVGLVPISAGVLMFFPNHAEIDISATDLTGIEVAGPVRFRRRRKLADITALRIGRTFATDNQSTESAPQGYGIHVEPTGRKRLILAPRYSLDLITPLASYLLQEIQRRGAPSILHPGEAASSEILLTVDPEPAALPVPEEPSVTQPPGSKITLIPAPDSLTFLIPRTGFRGTAAFFLFFSLFWNGLSFTIFSIVFWQFLQKPTLSNLAPVGFLLLFVGIGIGMALTAIQTAFRKAVLLATQDSLVFTQTGPIRNLEYQFPVPSLAAIRVDNSGTKINDKPLKQLEIHTTPDPSATNPTPAKRGLLAGRDEPELLWLASTLRRFYNIRA